MRFVCTRNCVEIGSMFHPIIRYRYHILFGFFTLWMLFFDMNNVFYRYRVAQEISDLEESIAQQKEKIARLEVQKRELFGNERKLERFAREKYLMKRDGEDVFIIVEEESETKGSE